MSDRTSRRGPVEFHLPFEPFELWLHENSGGGDGATQFIAEQYRRGQLLTNTYIARVCHAAVNTVLRWRQSGVPYFAADRICTALESSVWEIWSDYLDLLHRGVDFDEEDPLCA